MRQRASSDTQSRESNGAQKITLPEEKISTHDQPRLGKLLTGAIPFDPKIVMKKNLMICLMAASLAFASAFTASAVAAPAETFVEEIMRCRHDFRPASVIRLLQDEGYIGKKYVYFVDGIPTFSCHQEDDGVRTCSSLCRGMGL